MVDDFQLVDMKLPDLGCILSFLSGNVANRLMLSDRVVSHFEKKTQRMMRSMRRYGESARHRCPEPYLVGILPRHMQGPHLDQGQSFTRPLVLVPSNPAKTRMYRKFQFSFACILYELFLLTPGHMIQRMLLFSSSCPGKCRSRDTCQLAT